MGSRLLYWRGFSTATVCVALAVGCGSLFPASSTPGISSTTGQPDLTEGDFPNLPPCANRDIVPSDDTFVEDLTAALDIIHTHTKYESDANLPAVCGLAAADNSLSDGQAVWDPSNGTPVNVCNAFSEELADFPGSDDFSPSMCRTTYAIETEQTADGFPRGGTYRVDACIEGQETSYDLRLRLTVSGADANKTWASLGIESADTLEVFDKKGIQVTSTETLRDLLVANPAGTTVTIRTSSGKKTHLSVGIQIICIKTRDACPIESGSCS